MTNYVAPPTASLVPNKDRPSRRTLPEDVQERIYPFPPHRGPAEGEFQFHHFEDGKLGKVTVKLAKPDPEQQALLDHFAMALSMSLQLGATIPEIVQEHWDCEKNEVMQHLFEILDLDYGKGDR